MAGCPILCEARVGDGFFETVSITLIALAVVVDRCEIPFSYKLTRPVEQVDQPEDIGAVINLRVIDVAAISAEGGFANLVQTAVDQAQNVSG